MNLIATKKRSSKLWYMKVCTILLFSKSKQIICSFGQAKFDYGAVMWFQTQKNFTTVPTASNNTNAQLKGGQKSTKK